ncbi:MAG: vWA domain-containing protein [Thermaurantimonas sp.]|uniref:vWA domain-containing protein n=1 Tax=Thermaurantimonas sp. TaxID=2681568 RepID=UPI00391D6000
MLEFTTEFSMLWWVIAVLAVAWFVMWIYKSQQSVFGRKGTEILRVLRIVSLALLLFLLLKPELYIKKLEEKPRTLVWAVDHSRSMVMSKDSTDVGKLPTFLQTIADRVKGNLEVDVISFGSKVSENPDFNFNQPFTDGYAWIKHLQDTRFDNEIAAVVLVSDGIFNFGYSPEYFVHELKVPIHVVAVGDTTQFPDASIYSVVYPKKVLPNTEFEIEIIAKALYLENIPLKIRLKGEGTNREIATFRPTSSSESRSFKTFIKSIKPGIHRYSVTIDPVSKEKNTRNNTYVFYVEVIDERSKVLIIEEMKHPDMGVLREYFSKNTQCELISVKPDSLRFLNSNFDYVIVHSPAHPQTFAFLQKNNALPVLLISGFGTDPGGLSKLIGRDVTRFSREDKAYPIANDNFYKISSVNFLSIYPLPPLDVFYYIPNVKAEDVLCYQKINGINTTKPLISLLETDRKIALFHGEGLWKWKNKLQMEGDSNSLDLFFLKVTRWLIQSEKKKPLEIVLPEKIQPEDKLLVRAYVFDQTNLPVSNAKVSIIFTDSAGKKFEYSFAREGSVYTASAHNFTPGTYRWKAEAELAGEKQTESGILIVEENDLEISDLVANHDKLRKIAKNTEGKFYLISKMDELEKDLLAQNYLPLLREKTQKIRLIEWWPFFAIVLILLTAEWFLRRYLGSY